MGLGAPPAPTLGGKRLAATVSDTPAATPAGVDGTWVVLAVGAITVLAGCLRLLWLARVDGNPFYDAAVRSMGLSLHNFFFGAFEPSGSASIDKPPVDLWLQVASVKLLGFNGRALKLPEALASTLAVPLLYDAVRRVFGTVAGLCAALALAVLPIAVLTGRSDTMDAVMGLLLIAALWSLVRAAQTEHARWVPIAGVCIGLAFNVKLFEALVPLPAFAVGGWLALPGPFARRAGIAALAVALLIAVSLSWLTATSLVGSAPYAVGSTNGSAWNAAFVFNGLDRIQAAPVIHRGPVVHHRATHLKRLHRRKRARITPPGPARLLARRGSLPIAQLGLELLAALALGLPALWARRHEGRTTMSVGVTLGIWALTGAVLFSAMSRLHPRYTEAMTPAIAACVGIGVAWLGQASGRRLALAAITAVALAGFAVWAAFGSLAAAIGLGVTVAGVLLVVRPTTRPAARGRLAGLGVALVLGGLLAAPATDAVRVVSLHLSDSGRPGAMPHKRIVRLSEFLRSHRHGARYEFAAAAATQAGPLIAHDGQPVLILTSYNGRALLSTSQLVADVARGDVRYVLLGSIACRTNNSQLAACSAPAKWVRSHGTDVSGKARVGRGLLWQLRSPTAGLS